LGKLRVGVIGVGGFGELHVAAYQTLPDVEVVAVSDNREERLREVAARYGIGASYTDPADLCARAAVDLVSIVTPENDHLAPVLAATGHGRHIFLEKPIATSLEDGQRIIHAAEKAGVYLMVGHILRFESRYATVKHIVAEGRLGDLVSIHARRNRPKKLYAIYGNRVPGLVVNAIHDIDLCLWYTGQRVVRVRAFTRNIQKGKNPDINWGFLEFENGAVACIQTHWLHPDQAGVVTDDGMQLIGTKGTANIDVTSSGLQLWTEAGCETPNVSYDAWFHNEIRGPIKEELSYFVRCVREQKRPAIITPVEALAALEVALALVRSGQQDREVNLVQP
jgi:predicted dehydrogenase